MNELRQCIAARRDEAVDLLQKLVATPSVNPNFFGVERASVIGGESACSELLHDRYCTAGVERHFVAEDPERKNFVGVREGVGGGRSLLLNGHVDTVPPVDQDGWMTKDPWTPEIRGDRLYGLGSTDMKGGLVAIWLAVQALEDAGVRLKGDLQVHAVVGEETWEHELGTTACVGAGFRADGAIVAEPTSYLRPLTVCPVSAGLWHCRIVVRGKSTHAGNRPLAIRPGGPGDEIGVNALEKGILVVQALQALESEWGMTKRHPYFPPGFFNLLPGVFYADAGYPVPFYFPDRAEIQYDIWHSPEDSAEDVVAEVERFVAATCRQDTWLREHPPEFDWIKHYPPMLTEWEHPLVRSMVRGHEAAGGDPIGDPSPANPVNFGAALDGTWLQIAGIPSIAYGPGNTRIAHCKDEWVAIPEVIEAAGSLAGAIVDWCELAS